MTLSMRTGRFLSLLAVLAGSLAMVACGGPPPIGPSSGESQQQGSAAATTPNQGTDREGTTATTSPAGSASPGIAPAEVTVGDVTLVLTLQPVRHMFDQASVTSAPPGQPSAELPKDQQKDRSKGSAVLGGRMVDVANNIDPSQNPPADSAESVMRHVVVQVKGKSGEAIPYLDLTMDVLLDGRPTLFDQALVPMAGTDGGSSSVYYGNNLKFPRQGDYQIFVRMQPSPLLGQDQTPAAQFNLTLR